MEKNSELGELRAQEKKRSLNRLRGLIWTLRDGNNKTGSGFWSGSSVYSIVFSLRFLCDSWIVYQWVSGYCSWSWGSFFLLGYLAQLCSDDFFKSYYILLCYVWLLSWNSLFSPLRDKKWVVLGNRRSGEEMGVLDAEGAQIRFYCVIKEYIFQFRRNKEIYTRFLYYSTNAP